MKYFLKRMESATLNLVSVTFSEHLLYFTHSPMPPLLFQEAERKMDLQKKEHNCFCQAVANITVIYITATPRTKYRKTGRISLLPYYVGIPRNPRWL